MTLPLRRASEELALVIERGSVVGDYVTLQRGTTYRGDLVGAPGPALLGLGSIEPGGGFREGNYKTFGGYCPEKLTLFPGDIYVALKGATKDGSMIGSVARVPASVASGRLTQDTAKLVFIDRDPHRMKHLYWMLRTPKYREYCARRAIGTTAVALNRNDFLAYPVPRMSPSTRRLVELLEDVEAKIDVNRKMNRTLEAIARRLFGSWFVEFDPVHAKVEGSDTEVVEATADLFPDRFEESAIGELPLGWRSATLAEFAELNPESWSRDDRPATIEYVDLSNTKWGRIDATATHPSQSAPSRAQRVLRPGDTIVGTVRPGNGSYALVNGLGLTGSTGFAVLRPRRTDFTEFVYLAATSEENIRALAHRADGAAYPAVRPDVVLETPVVRASDEVIARFAELSRPLLQRMARNDNEDGALAAVRGALLARLPTGASPAPETEQVLEAVVG